MGGFSEEVSTEGRIVYLKRLLEGLPPASLMVYVQHCLILEGRAGRVHERRP